MELAQSACVGYEYSTIRRDPSLIRASKSSVSPKSERSIRLGHIRGSVWSVRIGSQFLKFSPGYSRMQSPEELPISKSRKKKSVAPKKQASQLCVTNSQLLPDIHRPVTLNKAQRPSKRNLQNLVPVSFVKQETSPSDSLPESSSSEDGYRMLRRKYLMLEEESFIISRETMEIEDQVKSLEDEKLALLDELVVLEGLVDPSEFKPLSARLP